VLVCKSKKQSSNNRDRSLKSEITGKGKRKCIGCTAPSKYSEYYYLESTDVMNVRKKIKKNAKTRFLYRGLNKKCDLFTSELTERFRTQLFHTNKIFVTILSVKLQFFVQIL